VYIPKPIDTSKAIISIEIMEIAEHLAEHIHDVWASGRISDGWVWGPKRDDVQKHHPCLVPYSELPECEKAYDRNTALGTLKALLVMGYRIER
jgi:ryanodine receptor 2